MELQRGHGVVALGTRQQWGEGVRDLSALVDAGRLKAYSRLLVAGFLLAMAAMWLASSGNLAPNGKPLGADFVTFWTAGWLALDGNPVGAFDAATIFARQSEVARGLQHVFLWHYPPTFMLIAAPLALLPYLTAYYLFTAVSAALFVVAVRPLVPWREAAILLLALPGTFVCLMHGQNSLLSAALLATALISIDRRPVLAGICIGLLAYKPQFGLLFPLVLAVTGRWRVMVVAGITLAAFVGLSVAVFGIELWAAFLHNVPVVREVVETAQLPWGKMPSAFVFLRMMGVPQGAAYAVQTLLAVAVAGVTVAVWWRSGPSLLAGATLVAGTLLLTPYTFDYEMALLAVPLAIIARHLVRHGASLAERIGLLVLALSPLAMGAAVESLGVQVGFVCILATFAWSARLALARKWVHCTEVPARAVPAITTSPAA
jgi:alpha-1,2-mannosyltransferase